MLACPRPLFNGVQHLGQFISVRNNDDFTIVLSARDSSNMCTNVTAAKGSSWVVWALTIVGSIRGSFKTSDNDSKLMSVCVCVEAHASYLLVVVAKCVCQVDDVLETREVLQQFRRRESATEYMLGIIMCAAEWPLDLSIARKSPCHSNRKTNRKRDVFLRP